MASASSSRKATREWKPDAFYSELNPVDCDAHAHFKAYASFDEEEEEEPSRRIDQEEHTDPLSLVQRRMNLYDFVVNPESIWRKRKSIQNYFYLATPELVREDALVMLREALRASLGRVEAR